MTKVASIRGLEISSTSGVARGTSLFAAALLVGLLAHKAVIGAQGDCSQPVSAGANPIASDCLFVLQVAVGLQTCTPEPCVCDPTGDGGTTASDALTCLKKAVGENIMLLCPCDTTTTTLSSVDCSNDGNCFNDHCVCSDCDDDLFCSDPGKCIDNGSCNTFTEGCVCADCMTHPECLDN